ncbi:MAG: YihY/virulence factor BrkB family protein [Prevotellaceae bacterium]|jgi:membrane protein|nr:YihY/virulence factor BrkB family protein [Prevotellaceae bacterium]
MRKIIDFFVRIYHFVRHDIWRITGSELSHSKRIFYQIIKTIILGIRGFINSRLTTRSSALTYSILFAVVPIIALFISIARGFNADFEQIIENALQDTYVGQTGTLPVVMEFVSRYLLEVKGGLFIGVGIAFLLWSVMSFFMEVENAFNDIWQVKKSRSIVRQFTTYFALILLLPVLLIISSGLSIFINSTISHSFLHDIISPFSRILVVISPYLIVSLIFTLMFVLIPNAKVKFTNALIAGILAGVAFQAFQNLYIWGQVYLSKYNAVYGGFAAIPLLLLWIRISCLIILFGAELTYASQNIYNFDYETDSGNMSARYRHFLYLFITHIVIKQFEYGDTPVSAEDISKKHHLPVRIINQMCGKLVDSNILVEVVGNRQKNKAYHPAIDIHKLTVNFLFEKIESNGSELFPANRGDVIDDFWKKSQKIRESYFKHTADVLIKDL